jgi:hypothetical protein
MDSENLNKTTNQAYINLLVKNTFPPPKKQISQDIFSNLNLGPQTMYNSKDVWWTYWEEGSHFFTAEALKLIRVRALGPSGRTPSRCESWRSSTCCGRNEFPWSATQSVVTIGEHLHRWLLLCSIWVLARQQAIQWCSIGSNPTMFQLSSVSKFGCWKPFQKIVERKTRRNEF